MITLCIMIAVCSLIIEFIIMSKFPRLRRAVSSNSLINLASSLGISFILGSMFGAAGMIVMVGAMLATAISIPVYRVMYPRSKNKEVAHV